MNTRVGEMLDLIDCLAIYNGAAPKTKARFMSFAEQMEVD